jgi:long-chain acyl-CoA synthetase
MAFTDFSMVMSPLTLSQKERELDPRSYRIGEVEHKVTGLDRSIRFLAVLPLSHSYGISFMNFGSLAGGESLMLRWWNPELALKMIEEFRIGYIALVPTMYVQLLDHPDFDKYDLSSLKYCVSGAAPLDAEIGMKWHERTGVHIHEGWGLTESGATTSSNPFTRAPKYGSIGQNMLRCNTMKVFDDNDQPLAPGQIGEIVIRGPAVMKGYWNLPEETAQALRNGWLHTGDVGYVDDDGYFFITGRKKDLIIRGGENVSPKEVEEVICRHPGVLEAGCVGMKDRVYGEEIKAFVVLKPGERCSESEIIEFCKGQLPTFKTPKKVQFIEAMPKNLLGKLLRAELRKMQ